MDIRKAALGIFGLLLAAIAGFVALRFVASLTVAVFVYYSTRPVFRLLRKMKIPKKPSAVVAIAFFSFPLIFLLGYTFVVLLSELRVFVEEYPVLEALEQGVVSIEGIRELPELTPEGILSAYQAGELDGLVNFVTDNLIVVAGAIGNFLIGTLVVLVVTYYLLIEGYKIRDWILGFDNEGVLETYFRTADRELQTVMFGNLLTVIVISIFAMVVFTGYNAIVPDIANVPFPALAGALTGVASLVPVVGMKIVYIPLALIVAINSLLVGEPSALAYVVLFLLVAVIVVDTIPDFFLRPYLSGKYTHVGMLMLAYIFGPIVFGFHGLFFAPIVLVMGLTFVHTVLPYLQRDDVPAGLYRPKNELKLPDFVEDEEEQEDKRIRDRVRNYFTTG